MSAAADPGGRDFYGEMAAVIERATAQGIYSPPVLADEIVSELRERDPDLLVGWLDCQAAQFVRHQINLLDGSRRGRATSTRARDRFRRASEQHRESGSSESLTPFLDARFTVADGTRRRLRDMVKADCGHVALDYESRAAANRMYGAFFRALEKNLGDRAIGDVYTEEQIAAMFHRPARRSA